MTTQLTLVQSVILSVLVTLVSTTAFGNIEITHQSKADFLQAAFSGQPSVMRILRLTPILREKAKKILTHKYRGARVRYWEQGERTAWIIDEVGKEMPITMGLIIENNRLESVSILVYREERGGEVYQKSFLQQFTQIALNEEERLPKEIDGITGATLSVNAVTRVVNLALLLHKARAQY